MIGLVGLAAGGLLEIRRLTKRGQGTGDAQAQELRKAIEQYAKDLEQARRAGAAASQRVSGLEAQAARLSEQNAELLMSNLTLSEAKEVLEGQTNELALTNRRLTEQVEELSAAREAEAARFSSDMAALRDKVAGVLQRLFSNEIDEPAAVEALRELGCEVQFVPGAGGRGEERARGGSGGGATYTIEPRLLLDDPARMARLMQAARSASGSGSPRLLEGGASGGSSSGGLTPRLGHGMAAGTPPMMLTIGSNGGSSSSAGAPRILLSLIGSGGSSSAGDAGVGAGVGDTASGAADAVRSAPKDASPPRKALSAAAAAKGGKAAGGGSPSKAPKAAPLTLEQQGDNLVISSAPKAKGPKSRLGLSLTDATSVFKRGGGGGGLGDDFDAGTASGDVGGGRDLVLMK